MVLKNCAECNQLLNLSFFKKRNRINNVYYYPYCNNCLKIKNKQYKLDHNSEISEYEKQRYLLNKDYILEKKEIYYYSNVEKIKERNKIYAEAHKDQLREAGRIYKKKRKALDPSFRLRYRVSSAILSGLKKINSSKNNSSFLKYLLYSMKELKEHLESQFESWMTWNNWGTYNSKSWNDCDVATWTWNIDHIVPQSKLLYTSMEDDNFKKCWALENLRPLSSKLNCIKGNR